MLSVQSTPGVMYIRAKQVAFISTGNAGFLVCLFVSSWFVVTVENAEEEGHLLLLLLFFFFKPVQLECGDLVALG